MQHHVYILQCRDKSLYTGYTTDLKRRVKEHNSSKKAAGYTRGRRPVALKYSETFATRSEALKREFEIKSLSRERKLKLIRTS